MRQSKTFRLKWSVLCQTHTTHPNIYIFIYPQIRTNLWSILFCYIVAVAFALPQLRLLALVPSLCGWHCFVRIQAQIMLMWFSLICDHDICTEGKWEPFCKASFSSHKCSWRFVFLSRLWFKVIHSISLSIWFRSNNEHTHTHNIYLNILEIWASAHAHTHKTHFQQTNKQTNKAFLLYV